MQLSADEQVCRSTTKSWWGLKNVDAYRAGQITVEAVIQTYGEAVATQPIALRCRRCGALIEAPTAARFFNLMASGSPVSLPTAGKSLPSVVLHPPTPPSSACVKHSFVLSDNGIDFLLSKHAKLTTSTTVNGALVSSTAEDSDLHAHVGIKTLRCSVCGAIQPVRLTADDWNTL